MKSICKYSLDMNRTQRLKIPSYKILSVKINDSGCHFDVYALADTTLEDNPIEYEFKVYRTEEEVSDNIIQFNFIDTLIPCNKDDIAFHIYHRKL